MIIRIVPDDGFGSLSSHDCCCCGGVDICVVVVFSDDDLKVFESIPFPKRNWFPTALYGCVVVVATTTVVVAGHAIASWG